MHLAIRAVISCTAALLVFASALAQAPRPTWDPSGASEEKPPARAPEAKPADAKPADAKGADAKTPDKKSAKKSPGRKRAPDLLKEGDAATDFELKSLDGKQAVKLSAFRGQKPVALIFGSYTWPPFRRQVGALEAMYDKYGRQIEFYIVYIREAHPTDGNQAKDNIRAGILVEQPKTFDERLAVASQMCSKLEVSIPTLIDNLDDKVNRAYNALPDRLYLIGRDGKITYKGEPGPGGFSPKGLEAAIKKELDHATPSSKAAKPASASGTE